MSEVIVNSYTRRDILRILRIHAQQLRAWERAGIFPHIETYSFEHLVQLRKLRDLRSTRLSASHIRASIQAMQQASGMSNPLLEAGTARDGARVVFRHSGTLMDPIGGQLLFDFEHGADVAREDGHRFRREPLPQTPAAFLEAVQCEEGGNIEEAIALYEAILAQTPTHAPSAINLGTIYYHRKDYARAERLYRSATEADQNYALAFFDLGNVLDELQRMGEAIEAYQAAIRLVPRYADAHYNLALAYERQGARRQALRHWTAYIKLDPHGPWHNHARLQIRKILDREKLKIVARRSSVTK
uniref:Tetratricopeptide repeat protein n=1 Tax=Acidobacterium capsulatum TaxID=33075 RepID=A0A7V5CS75_9BACT